MGMVLCLRRVDDAEFRTKLDDFDAFDEYLNQPEDPADLVDFDKAWQALHFVLTGEPYDGEGPLNFLLGPWPEIGEDMGYGPGRLAPPSAVRAFRDALAGLDDAELRRRYDPAAMVKAQVYISEALAEEGEEGWQYVTQCLPHLRRLLDRSVELNSPVFIWIC